MSCDHELANEWARCSGKNASYITIIVIAVAQLEKHLKFIITMFILNATVMFQLASNAGLFGVQANVLSESVILDSDSLKSTGHNLQE